VEERVEAGEKRKGVRRAEGERGGEAGGSERGSGQAEGERGSE